MKGEKIIPFNPDTVPGRMPHCEKLSNRPAWSTRKLNHTRDTKTREGNKASHMRFLSKRKEEDVVFSILIKLSAKSFRHKYTTNGKVASSLRIYSFIHLFFLLYNFNFIIFRRN